MCFAGLPTHPPAHPTMNSKNAYRIDTIKRFITIYATLLSISLSVCLCYDGEPSVLVPCFHDCANDGTTWLSWKPQSSLHRQQQAKRKPEKFAWAVERHNTSHGDGLFQLSVHGLEAPGLIVSVTIAAHSHRWQVSERAWTASMHFGDLMQLPPDIHVQFISTKQPILFWANIAEKMKIGVTLVAALTQDQVSLCTLHTAVERMTRARLGALREYGVDGGVLRPPSVEEVHELWQGSQASWAWVAHPFVALRHGRQQAALYAAASMAAACFSYEWGREDYGWSLSSEDISDGQSYVEYEIDRNIQVTAALSLTTYSLELNIMPMTEFRVEGPHAAVGWCPRLRMAYRRMAETMQAQILAAKAQCTSTACAMGLMTTAPAQLLHRALPHHSAPTGLLIVAVLLHLVRHRTPTAQRRAWLWLVRIAAAAALLYSALLHGGSVFESLVKTIVMVQMRGSDCNDRGLPFLGAGEGYPGVVGICHLAREGVANILAHAAAALFTVAPAWDFMWTQDLGRTYSACLGSAAWKALTHSLLHAYILGVTMGSSELHTTSQQANASSGVTHWPSRLALPLLRRSGGLAMMGLDTHTLVHHLATDALAPYLAPDAPLVAAPDSEWTASATYPLVMQWALMQLLLARTAMSFGKFVVRRVFFNLVGPGVHCQPVSLLFSASIIASQLLCSWLGDSLPSALCVWMVFGVMVEWHGVAMEELDVITHDVVSAQRNTNGQVPIPANTTIQAGRERIGYLVSVSVACTAVSLACLHFSQHAPMYWVAIAGAVLSEVVSGLALEAAKARVGNACVWIQAAVLPSSTSTHAAQAPANAAPRPLMGFRRAVASFDPMPVSVMALRQFWTSSAATEGHDSLNGSLLKFDAAIVDAASRAVFACVWYLSPAFPLSMLYNAWLDCNSAAVLEVVGSERYPSHIELWILSGLKCMFALVHLSIFSAVALEMIGFGHLLPMVPGLGELQSRGSLLLQAIGRGLHGDATAAPHQDQDGGSADTAPQPPPPPPTTTTTPQAPTQALPPAAGSAGGTRTQAQPALSMEAVRVMPRLQPQLQPQLHQYQHQRQPGSGAAASQAQGGGRRRRGGRGSASQPHPPPSQAAAVQGVAPTAVEVEGAQGRSLAQVGAEGSIYGNITRWVRQLALARGVSRPRAFIERVCQLVKVLLGMARLGLHQAAAMRVQLRVTRVGQETGALAAQDPQNSCVQPNPPPAEAHAGFSGHHRFGHASQGSGAHEAHASRECCICFGPVGSVPCGFLHGGSVHWGYCEECAGACMGRGTPRCPVCQQEVERVVKLYTS